MEGKSCFSSPGESSGSPKNVKRRQPVYEGNVAFRILCFPSQASAVIGKEGCKVQEIKKSTNSKIWVEDGAMATDGSPEYVIMIVGKLHPKSRLTLAEKGEEGIMVSEPQQALITVFETLALSYWRNSTVSCRLLAEGSYLGDFRGGEDSATVKRIKKETGCQIEVRTHSLPICADSGDALVEIRGTFSAVKKALVSISDCLQSCQPITQSIRHVGSRRGHTESVPQEALYRASIVFQGDPLPISGSPKNWRLPVHEGNVAFRILCFPYQVPAVIGKNGCTVQKIRNSTESKIRVEDGEMAPHGSPEYVIMIVGKPSPKSRLTLAEKGEEGTELSQAQQALIAVFEVLIGGKSSAVSCRLLAEVGYSGALFGKGSEIVERIKKETGCEIEVRTDRLPICADLDDALVEIRGTYLAVKKALVSISDYLQVCQPTDERRHVGYMNMNVVPQEALYRASDVFQAEPREVDRYRTDLGRPFESFRPDAYQRRIEANTQGTLYQPRIDTHPHSMTVSKNQFVTFKQRPSALEDDNQEEISGTLATVKSVLDHVFKEDTNTPGMISHGEATNTGAISPSPSLTMSTSLHRKSEDSFQRGFHYSVNCSNPVNATPPFFSRFGPTAGYSPNFAPQSTTPEPAAPRGVHDGSGGLSSAMADLRLESEHRSSVATNTTAKITVPEHFVHFLCEAVGVHGPNLVQSMIQTTGASVIVHEPYPGRNDGAITVSGTPDQIQEVRYVLQSFERFLS